MPQNYLFLGWGSWNFNFFVFIPFRCYILNLVMICSVVLEKNMLMDDVDARQWTLIKNNRSLNDSGNLKRYMFFRKIFRKNLYHFHTSLNTVQFYLLKSSTWTLQFIAHKIWQNCKKKNVDYSDYILYL